MSDRLVDGMIVLLWIEKLDLRTKAVDEKAATCRDVVCNKKRAHMTTLRDKAYEFAV